MNWTSSWPKDENDCKEEGCYDKISRKGWCSKHYQRYYKAASDYRSIKLRKNDRDHHLYVIWWQRKKDDLLCERWLNFDSFVSDVSPKPEGNFFLVRRLGDNKFGPDNFIWQEHLKRKEGENRKDWWARKRAARIAANPSMESDRNIKRKHGLTRSQYNDMLATQNFGCAVCGEKETSVDGRTGTIKQLAVDHCHSTGKIRGLLCWRCNGTLGKIGDCLELLKQIEEYLIKTQGIKYAS